MLFEVYKLCSMKYLDDCELLVGKGV